MRRYYKGHDSDRRHFNHSTTPRLFVYFRLLLPAVSYFVCLVLILVGKFQEWLARFQWEVSNLRPKWTR